MCACNVKVQFCMVRRQHYRINLYFFVQGFSVAGQENIQEILSKQLYLCQFLCALSILRQGRHLQLMSETNYTIYTCLVDSCIIYPLFLCLLKAFYFYQAKFRTSKYVLMVFNIFQVATLYAKCLIYSRHLVLVWYT